MPAIAQVDSVSIKAITIHAEPLRYAWSKSYTSTIEAENIPIAGIQNTAAILSRAANIFIRQYGPGTLATAHIRGASSNQTAIVWNGVPIQHPMLGLLDLSTLQPSLHEKTSVLKGSPSAIYGSSAIGGVIHMQNHQPKDDRSFSFTGSLGSFGLQSTALEGSIRRKSWALSSKTLLFSTNNDFPFKRFNTDQTERLPHAQQRQLHHITSVYYTPHDRQKTSFHWWYTDMDRQIPPTTTQRVSAATQKDHSHRLSVQHDQRIKTNQRLQLVGGYTREGIHFVDSLGGVDSDTRFSTGYGEVTWSLFHKRSTWFVTTNMQYAVVESGGNYATNPDDTRLGLTGGFAHRMGEFWLRATALQQIWNSNAIPLIPSVQLGWQPVEHLEITTTAQKAYRLPSLNDLYWVPGGDPAMRPESGWSFEQNLDWKILRHSGWEVALQQATFLRNVDNWIQWAPKTGSPLWAARNLERVKTYGLESKIDLSRNLENASFGVEAQYQYVSSTYQGQESVPGLQLGNQLPFTPEHLWTTAVSATLKKHRLSYTHQWTRAQETNLNYDLANITYEGHTLIGDQQFTWGAVLENVWNRSYRIWDNRPMPGRWGQLSIKYQLSK